LLFLSNQDIQQVLTIEDTICVIEEGHRELARQELVARPRVDIYTETASPAHYHRWGTMEGSSKGLHRHAIRMKSDVVSWRDHGGGRVEDKYCYQPGLFCGLIFLFDTNNGEPLAIMNEGYLQHMRVGALAALGAKYLAKSDASSVGMLGAGGMAHSHLMAFAAVRRLKQAKVYSPTPAHREAYAKEMSELLDLEVIPCASAAEAARGTDILSTCTNSMVPTVLEEMLEPGMHLTAVAAELSPEVIGRVNVAIGGDPSSQLITGVAIDDTKGFPTYLAGSRERLEEALGSARRRAGLEREGETPAHPQTFRGRLVPMVDLIEGTAQGRQSDAEITASNGVRGGGGKQGLQFVTTASIAYDKAKAAGLGHEIPTEWFLQDIRN
jgi:ornithine cyclodeaminase/alanine dehydrogenase-like protein (mu-crystallin family)